MENATVVLPAAHPGRRHRRADRRRRPARRVDHGIGMTAERLAEENARLTRRERLDLAPTEVLGLFVVGRLARRHGSDGGPDRDRRRRGDRQPGAPGSALARATTGRHGGARRPRRSPRCRRGPARTPPTKGRFARGSGARRTGTPGRPAPTDRCGRPDAAVLDADPDRPLVDAGPGPARADAGLARPVADAGSTWPRSTARRCPGPIRRCSARRPGAWSRRPRDAFGTVPADPEPVQPTDAGRRRAGLPARGTATVTRSTPPSRHRRSRRPPCSRTVPQANPSPANPQPSPIPAEPGPPRRPASGSGCPGPTCRTGPGRRPGGRHRGPTRPPPAPSSRQFQSGVQRAERQAPADRAPAADPGDTRRLTRRMPGATLDAGPDRLGNRRQPAPGRSRTRSRDLVEQFEAGVARALREVRTDHQHEEGTTR